MRLLRNAPGVELQAWLQPLAIEYVEPTLFAIEPKDDDDTIYAAARREFGERSPFRPGNRIVEVVIAVRFRPTRGRRAGPTIGIKLIHPNGCNLKDKSERERLLAEKYLKRWGIIEDLSVS